MNGFYGVFTDKVPLFCRCNRLYYVTPKVDEDFIKVVFLNSLIVLGEIKIKCLSDSKIEMETLELVSSDSMDVNWVHQGLLLGTKVLPS